MSTAGRIVVVGLGPGGHGHVTDETRQAIAATSHRYLRTARHPSADLVPGAVTFDEWYETADTFDDVYTSIVEVLIDAAATHGEIVYAVPGSPLVLERTVRLLRQHGGPELVVLPAMSFLDVAWARLGVDPVESGVRLIDGHDFAVAAAGDTGPLLVAHTHANWVLSDIKLALDDNDRSGDFDDEVFILQRLGTDDELITTTTWGELDRTVEADHLTALFIPRLAAPVAAGYMRFHQLARTLREQCPWDIEQTHASLLPHLIEETYEVVDAVGALDPDDSTTDNDLIEELGDLLYQIEFHATIAEQEGRFTIADVTEGIHDKLVRRHPHVFGDVEVGSTSEVLSNWDAIKNAEKQRTSALDGIPRSLPSLAYAQRIGAKAGKSGFDWPDVAGAFAKIQEETNELEATFGGEPARTTSELGDLLFAVVNVARHVGVDAELALREASEKFRRRFEYVEGVATSRGIDLRDADLVQLDALWDEAKSTGL